MSRRTRLAVLAACLAVAAAGLLVGLPTAAQEPAAPAPKAQKPGGEQPKPPAIPQAWSFREDGLEPFPLLDFTTEADRPEEPDRELEKKLAELGQRVERLAGQKKWAEARKALDAMLADHEHHRRTSQAFNNYVARLCQHKEMKDQALKTVQELIRRFPAYRWSAYHYIQQLTGSRLYFHASGGTSVEPGKRPTLTVRGRKVDRIRFAVYEVDLFAMVAEGVSPLAPAVPKDVKPLKTWTHKPKTRVGGDWFSDDVDIPVEEPGAYLVTLGTEHYEWTTLVFVSRLAVATKGDGRILLAYAGNTRGGEAPGPCEIAVMDNERVVYRGKTTPRGLFVGRVEGQARSALVVLRRGEDWAVSHAQSTYSRGSYGRIYAYTDRPVYRPEQTVHIKLVLRRYNYETDTVEFKPGDEVRVQVRDPRWNEVVKKTVEVNEFGTATLEMALAEEPPLGQYRIQLSGPGAGGYAHFFVQEYKKPEFEVEVVPGAENAVLGEPLTVNVEARYYFGEPVKDAEVSYEVYANPAHYHYPWWRRRYPCYWFLEAQSTRPHVGGQMVARGTGRLDAQGTFQFRVDTEKLARDKGHGYRLTLRASVTDKSRRQIQGYGSVHLAQAGLRLAIHADRYSYRPGDQVAVDIRTTDLEGRGTAAAVKMAVRRRDSDGEYLVQSSEVVETNAQGHGSFAFVSDQSGWFQVTASATDKAGREVSRTIGVWVVEHGWRSPYHYSGLNVETDRELYRPGDQARVLVTTGYADHPVLVTIEGERIQSYRLARFNGSLLTFDQPITTDHAPTSSVAATVFAQGSYVANHKRLVVPPADKWVDIAIQPDKPQYKPGESAVYTLALTDHRGEPVEAELSFALVDEAIYAIQPDAAPDIRKFYYGHRRRYIYTRTSFHFYSRGLGGPAAQGEQRAAAEPAPAAAPGAARTEAADMAKTAEAKGGQMAEARLRKDFADSAVWQPTLRTDADGTVAVPFKMPDNLTTWRAKVVAITRDGRVGQATHKVITRQNLMVRLECPRTFTERDEVTVSAVVHNYLAEGKDCAVSLKTSGGRLLGEPRRTLHVSAGADQRVDWRLQVDTHQPIKLTVAALTDEESDAMELTIPVVPHGIKLLVATSGMLHSDAQATLVLPDDADLEKSVLRVSLSPSLAATMFESLDYLVQYPYGCVEQTMSRFLPAVVVAQVLQKLQMRDEELEAKLPEVAEKGLQRLYGFQHGDGSWGWWKRDKPNGYMTAYVLYGLAVARQADLPVSDNAVQRGLNVLRKLIPKEESPDTRAYMTFAYANLARPQPDWLDDLYAQRRDLSDYALALLALACHRTGQEPRAEALADLLVERADTTENTAHWGGGHRHYHWQRNNIQATAYAVKALVAARPRHPLLPKAVAWLVTQRQGNYWYSTKDTAAAIFALADHMKASGELDPDYTPSLSVNGRRVETAAVKGHALELKPQTFEFAAADLLRRGENVIHVGKEGKGNLYYSAALEYYTRGEDLEATEAGLKVRREYYRLVPQEEGGKITFQRLPLGREARGGQEIEVRVTVAAEKNHQYFMLEDFLPAGCEVVADKSDLDNRYRHWWHYCSNREARDEKVVFFATYLSAGEHTFIYTLRTETPGEFHVMPAQASLMYQPDVRGSSAENRLTIFEP
ncbi:MAG: alpha-2-macroglobulin family protein [Candidatus Brocadiia bacterium]